MSRVKLLTSNAKLDKSNKLFDGVINAGLALAPHQRSGHNVCGNAGFCSAVCLAWFSGRLVTSPARNAMLRRTRWLFADPKGFREALEREWDLLQRKAQRRQVVAYVRLNIASDLNWSHVAANFPRIRFYDYTKSRKRIRCDIDGTWPNNYSLTFSYSERVRWSTIENALAHGRDASIVFDTEYLPQVNRIGKLPETFRGYRVVDGDVHELRHPDFDGRGNIIALGFKGSRRPLTDAIRRGFVIKS